MQSLELKNLFQNERTVEKKLSEQEMCNITGAGLGKWIFDVVVGGATYDALKAGANWTKENLPASTQGNQVLRQYDINPTIMEGVDVTGFSDNIA